MSQPTQPAPHATDTDLAAALQIDRLVLHVPSMSEADARALAEQVARQVSESLRDWPTAPAASGRIARLSTTVAAPADASSGAAMGAGGNLAPPADPGELARRIARSVLAAALREVR
jgi:hypothetical protein